MMDIIKKVTERQLSLLHRVKLKIDKKNTKVELITGLALKKVQTHANPDI